ncbi:MAPEG family protein [Lichenihabitans sp. Uapishka_5]|uniref:MAPEG family protein n=1 Tax=Lichenihabitans sp. Uapishka_5 TaxID=3037302 RepID=UPI0029E81555|nr:MAPEG family protein [Lichenihabitans sp. Uapishka_5]MDX7950124.1 MAPEG family protein [Lichenihabitans sp. Uapishka_5]
MLFPTTTATFAGLFGLIYVGLTAWVMISRTTFNTLEGDSGNPVLQKRVRSQGNFGEYVPIGLVLIALLEGGGGGHGLVMTVLLMLLIGRVLHPFGLFAAPGSAPMFACRGGGMLLTLLSLLITSLALLIDFA